VVDGLSYKADGDLPPSKYIVDILLRTAKLSVRCNKTFTNCATLFTSDFENDAASIVYFGWVKEVKTDPTTYLKQPRSLYPTCVKFPSASEELYAITIISLLRKLRELSI
jgi:hypothetical protein